MKDFLVAIVGAIVGLATVWKVFAETLTWGHKKSKEDFEFAEKFFGSIDMAMTKYSRRAGKFQEISMMLEHGRFQPNLEFATAIPYKQDYKAIPPNKAEIASKRKQPPQQSRRFVWQTFEIGCSAKQKESKATNFAFCSYNYSAAIVPNSPILPVLIAKRVNIYGVIAGKRKEFSDKKALCLTPQFHVDALRAQHECGPLATRLRRPELQMSNRSTNGLWPWIATDSGK